jgi:hypothetical protein
MMLTLRLEGAEGEKKTEGKGGLEEESNLM